MNAIETIDWMSLSQSIPVKCIQMIDKSIGGVTRITDFCNKTEMTPFLIDKQLSGITFDLFECVMTDDSFKEFIPLINFATWNSWHNAMCESDIAIETTVPVQPSDYEENRNIRFATSVMYAVVFALFFALSCRYWVIPTQKY